MKAINDREKSSTLFQNLVYIYVSPISHAKQFFISPMITFCCSSVILLSLGRQHPLSKISAPLSKVPPAIYAFVIALPVPPIVTNSFIRNIGCICIGFQIGRPSALIEAIASRISVGQVFPCSAIYNAFESSLTCLQM